MAEPPKGEQVEDVPSSAAADIKALSRVALQESLAELSSTAQKTYAVASSAWRGLLLGAESHLGIEVSIEDPAQRDLFGYLVQVEGLLQQLRCQAEALLRGADALVERGSIGSSSSTSMDPKALISKAAATDGARAGSALTSASPLGSPRGGAVSMVGIADSLDALAQVVATTSADGSKCVVEGLSGVKDAAWHTFSRSPNAGDRGSAAYRAEKRLQEEVLDPIDRQLTEFAKLRESLRTRHQQRLQLEESLREVAMLQKSRRNHKGLRPLVDPGSALERLEQAQAKAAALDADVLEQLLAVKQDAACIVGRLWAAFGRVRAEFFCLLAGSWAPVATAAAAGITGATPATMAAEQQLVVAAEVAAGKTPPPPPPPCVEGKRIAAPSFAGIAADQPKPSPPTAYSDATSAVFVAAAVAAAIPAALPAQHFSPPDRPAEADDSVQPQGGGGGPLFRGPDAIEVSQEPSMLPQQSAEAETAASAEPGAAPMDLLLGFDDRGELGETTEQVGQAAVAQPIFEARSPGDLAGRHTEVLPGMELDASAQSTGASAGGSFGGLQEVEPAIPASGVEPAADD